MYNNIKLLNVVKKGRKSY